MRSNIIKRWLAAVAAITLVGGGYALHGMAAGSPASPAPIAAPVPSVAPIGSSSGGLPDFTAIVQRFGPAVVNISVSGNMKTDMGAASPLDPDDPLFQFFKRFGVPLPSPGSPGEVPMHALGSGFIVSPDGIVLTNAHVVEDAKNIIVKLTDKREFDAKLIGLDKPSDVAVLKINARNLPTVVIGNPANERVGEWVVAMGSPFGFENSVTAGIVSAKSRSLPDSGYVPFIQTDVAVNPGNSGGPLFNVQGQVIGINSQIYSRSGGYQGLSFAIPIDVAMNVEGQILAHGKVTRGRIGVSIQDVDQGIADSFGLKSPKGAIVSAVEPGGPAEKAGLQSGDVILKVNGAEVAGASDLPPKISAVNPGQTVKLDVWRNNTMRQVEVKVAESQPKEALARSSSGAPHDKLGVAVRPLTPEERSQAGTSGGLLVEDSSGPAAQAGIMPGDIILSCNGMTVSSVDKLRETVGKAGKHVALLVQRNNDRRFVAIELG